jgi:hypothetical protein
LLRARRRITPVFCFRNHTWRNITHGDVQVFNKANRKPTPLLGKYTMYKFNFIPP